MKIPSIKTILNNAFKPGFLNWKSHFGLYPFEWEKGWELSVDKIILKGKPLLQVAPVLEKLVFPRAKKEFLRWLDQVSSLKGMNKLVSAHFISPVNYSRRECMDLRQSTNFENWSEDNEKALNKLADDAIKDLKKMKENI